MQSPPHTRLQTQTNVQSDKLEGTLIGDTGERLFLFPRQNSFFVDAGDSIPHLLICLEAEFTLSAGEVLEHAQEL